MVEEERVRDWFETLQPGLVRGLFEYLPNMLYFAKNSELELMAGNRAFVQRCGFEKESELIGRTDREIFSVEMAEKYGRDDRLVLETGNALVGMVELFPNRMGEPEWFVTDKIPLYTRSGEIAGLCGLVRSLEGARAEIQPYLDLVPATDYLKKNFSEKIMVADLAKLVGMSVRQLERRFRETFKTTPQQYILKLRLLEACELLVGSQMPITEIALEVGFYDHSSFSRKFSMSIGVSPSQYRKGKVRKR